MEGLKSRESIPGLTKVYRDTPDSLLKQLESDLESGVRPFLLFGVPHQKWTQPDSSLADFTASQIHQIKRRFGHDLFLWTDVCLCSTTAHGHCGWLTPEQDHVHNDATVETLAQMSLQFAQAGVDGVAPSDMMDGRIAAIRNLLNKHGYEQTVLMSYAIKFHSGFYGPFRVAADSAPKQTQLTNRATYQIDPGNIKDALLCAQRDAQEGADLLMVKPGLPYLDVLKQASDEIPLPWSVYQVSGEFASTELLAQAGLIQRERAHLEQWTAFLRAGAQCIITYGARDARTILQSQEQL